MIREDWVKAVVTEVHVASMDLLDGSISAPVLREIITKHCPFKPDVAYMPVPRCESCSHWARLKEYHPNDKDLGQCGLMRLSTDSNFGCVQWETK